MRTIDKTKKSNIKCEHCVHWSGWLMSQCKLKKECKQYYQRCKQFDWNPKLNYKEP